MNIARVVIANPLPNSIRQQRPASCSMKNSSFRLLLLLPMQKIRLIMLGLR